MVIADCRKMGHKFYENKILLKSTYKQRKISVLSQYKNNKLKWTQTLEFSFSKNHSIKLQKDFQKCSIKKLKFGLDIVLKLKGPANLSVMAWKRHSLIDLS